MPRYLLPLPAGGALRVECRPGVGVVGLVRDTPAGAPAAAGPIILGPGAAWELARALMAAATVAAPASPEARRE